nr:F-box protein At3g07870-like [Ipomoea batatas]
MSTNTTSIESETIQTFPSAPPPPAVPEDDWIRRSIGVLGNCLCLCDNTERTRLDIWVMKEYGNGDSWTKEFSIGAPDEERDESLMCASLISRLPFMSHPPFLWRPFLELNKSNRSTPPSQ